MLVAKRYDPSHHRLEAEGCIWLAILSVSFQWPGGPPKRGVPYKTFVKLKLQIESDKKIVRLH